MPRPEVVAYAEAQNAKFDKLEAGVTKVAADAEWQKKELERWNNLPPTWTPEDQSILDGLIARNATAITNIEAVDALVEDRPSVPDVPAEPTPPTP